MFVGLISDIGHKEAHKEVMLWALGKALREKGVLSVILREPALSGNTSAFLARQMAVCMHDREFLERYGVLRQLSGFAGVEEEPCRTFEVSAWALGKKVPVYERALFLLPQLRYHGISEKPELAEPYLFADIKNMTGEAMEAICSIAAKEGISQVVMVQYGEGDTEVFAAGGFGAQKAGDPLAEGKAGGRGTRPRLVECIPVEDTEKYVGALWMSAVVVTDRYVGASLALIHEKPFLVAGNSGQEAEKTRELLALFQMEGHILEGGGKVQDISPCYAIHDETSLRKNLRALRDAQGARMAEELLFEDADMLVKCPVKIPVSQCSACGACEAVCPRDAIRMEPDAYGFLHPVVDETLCDECGWCSDACIKRGQRHLVQFADESYPRFYTAKGKESRAGAYSGVFGQLVRYLVKERDAVVFGSILNEELKPVVVWTQDVQMAERFAEKRYLINDTKAAFRKVKEFLDANRFVLYTGSACECAGLRGYLKRHYPKLFLCELLCHETISNRTFGLYADMLSRRKDSKLTDIRFGDFTAGTGAGRAVLCTQYENGESGRLNYGKSKYMQMIEQQLLVNEACANCSYLGKKRVGDITLADFQKNIPDLPKAWQNVSVVMVGTAKGGRVFDQLSGVAAASVEFDSILRFLYKKTAAMPNERPAMLKLLKEGDLGGILKNVAKK